MNTQILSINDHRRDRLGMVYVYPVVSRRAGGVSVGINLNTNKACNWGCVYCQVEGLTRGGPLPVDLDRLEAELSSFLNEVVQGDYLEKHVAPECRKLADLAFSGDGEPTSAPEFGEAIKRVGKVLESLGLKGQLPVRLITNGSLMHKPEVQQALRELAALGGEAWFKVDRGDESGMLAVNKTRMTPERVLENLRICGELIPTWVQTCWFGRAGTPPGPEDEGAYLSLLTQVASAIKGIHLYGLARPSCQPEAGELMRLGTAEMQCWGMRITKETGIKVNVSP